MSTVLISEKTINTELLPIAYYMIRM